MQALPQFQQQFYNQQQQNIGNQLAMLQQLGIMDQQEYNRYDSDIGRAIKEAGLTGKPIARPLVFDYPDDSNVTDIWDEYMFGPDILVAPIWKSGERQREVYIPDGEFVSYWDPNETIVGPETITVNAPLDQIPFFIRKGIKILGREW